MALWIEFCHNYNSRLEIHEHTHTYAHTHIHTHISRTDKSTICTMSNLKPYVANLRIFQIYPILEVIEYDQNIRMYKRLVP